MYKHIFTLVLLVLFFTACTDNSLVKFDDQNVSVKIDKENYYTLPTQKDKSKSSIAECVFDSFYFRDFNGDYDFSLDYIKLNLNCDWTGFSKGIYESHIENSNTLRLKFVEEFEVEDFTVGKYTTSKNCEFYLMGIYGVGEEIFIVDKKGTLAKDISPLWGVDIDVNIENICSDEILALEYSIIRKNFFYNYFEKNRKNESDIIWLLQNQGQIEE